MRSLPVTNIAAHPDFHGQPNQKYIPKHRKRPSLRVLAFKALAIMGILLTIGTVGTTLYQMGIEVGAAAATTTIGQLRRQVITERNTASVLRDELAKLKVSETEKGKLMSDLQAQVKADRQENDKLIVQVSSQAERLEAIRKLLDEDPTR